MIILDSLILVYFYLFISGLGPDLVMLCPAPHSVIIPTSVQGPNGVPGIKSSLAAYKTIDLPSALLL